MAIFQMNQIFRLIGFIMVIALIGRMLNEPVEFDNRNDWKHDTKHDA